MGNSSKFMISFLDIAVLFGNIMVKDESGCPDAPSIKMPLDFGVQLSRKWDEVNW